MTKRFLGAGNLLLREVGGSSISERFFNWTARIRQSRSPSFSAIDTYSGGYWSVIRSLNAAFVNNQAATRLWIVSAGYGLISPNDEIIPYGATFAPGQPDSISGSNGSSPESSMEWWRLLSQWHPPSVPVDAPRSVEDVIVRHPGAANLLVLSPDYFRALRDDLRETLNNMPDSKKLIILSSDDRPPGALAANTIKIDARLQVYLGGARSSLGIRTARTVLQELTGKPVTVDSFRAAMESLVARHGVVQVYDREPMTNEQVVEYINVELAQDASISSTRLLGKLRGSGRACERKRFHKLFITAKEQRTASLFTLNSARA